MNLGLREIGGSALCVSQFTLAGSVDRGRRPSFDQAMEPGEIVDKRFAQLAGRLGVSSQPFRRISAQDDSLYPFHQVEGRTEHRRVFTVKKRRRSLRVNQVQFREYAVLPTHIMRGFDLTAERRTAQHHLAVAQTHQISQVGMSAGKLFDRERSDEIRQVFPDPGFKPGYVKLFAGAHRLCAVGVITHRHFFV